MIRYVEGDATALERGVLVHVCNDIGAWGRGFTAAVSARWSEPEEAYRAMRTPRYLGRVDIVPVAPMLWVANLIGQHGIRSERNPHPVDYDAIRLGLAGVAGFAAARPRLDYAGMYNAKPVHMPRIGCGLAGGEWGRIEPLVAEMLGGLDVTVYDLPGRQDRYPSSTGESA